MKTFQRWFVWVGVCSLFACTALLGGALAQPDPPPDPSPPNLLNYQGILKDSAGQPLSGNYDLTFRLHHRGGWWGRDWYVRFTEVHYGVEVADGLFSVILGSVDPESNPLTRSDLYNSNCGDTYDNDCFTYLSIQVDDGDIMEPWIKLTSAPYSFGAEFADSAVGANRAKTAGYADSARVALLAGTSDDDWTIEGSTIYKETGVVGIGTASPSPFAKLTVEKGDLSARLCYGTSLPSYVYYAVRGSNGTVGTGYLAYEDDNSGGQYYGVYGAMPAGAGNRWAGLFDGDLAVMSAEPNNDVVKVLASDGSDLLRLNETSGGHGEMILCNASGTTKVRLSSNSYNTFDNNVGIGIGLPTEKLTVKGNILLVSVTDESAVLELGQGLDYAEGFDVTESMVIEPGTVLSIDPSNPGNLTVSTRAYDSRVAGIVAGGKGLGSGVRLGVDQFDQDVALAGRVYCNAIASDAAIEPGDLLTTSDVPGFAMKATDCAGAQGAILGKAMERLEKGETGQIMVLVTLQ
jgi:hypothetical protein